MQVVRDTNGVIETKVSQDVAKPTTEMVTRHRDLRAEKSGATGRVFTDCLSGGRSQGCG